MLLFPSGHRTDLRRPFFRPASANRAGSTPSAVRNLRRPGPSPRAGNLFRATRTLRASRCGSSTRSRLSATCRSVRVVDELEQLVPFTPGRSRRRVVRPHNDAALTSSRPTIIAAIWTAIFRRRVMDAGIIAEAPVPTGFMGRWAVSAHDPGGCAAATVRPGRGRRKWRGFLSMPVEFDCGPPAGTRHTTSQPPPWRPQVPAAAAPESAPVPVPLPAAAGATPLRTWSARTRS